MLNNVDVILLKDNHTDLMKEEVMHSLLKVRSSGFY